MKSKVLVIVGPTASGKSDLAVRLAKKFNGEIISADSRQVYKGLNIGTGKITKAEMKGVPHHLLDVADPRKRFSVADYKKLAEEKLSRIINKNKLPIVVGGTGFYIDTLAGNISLPDVPPNPKLRKRLEQMTASELFKLLKQRDKDRAEHIDPHNKVRLIRALEIVDLLGKVPKPTDNKQPTTYNFIYIGLKPDDLDDKIHKRLIARIPGMIKEAKRLHKKGLTWKRMEELGLEYRYLARLLQNKLTKDEFIKELYLEIRHYAKRQMTWFKRNKNIEWFNPDEYKAVEKYARIALKSGD